MRSAEAGFSTTLTVPLPPRIFTRLADIRIRRNRIADAEHTVRECLDLCPQSAEAYDVLAKICYRTGRIEQARDHAETAMKLAPNDRRYRQRHQKLVAKIGADR